MPERLRDLPGRLVGLDRAVEEAVDGFGREPRTARDVLGIPRLERHVGHHQVHVPLRPGSSSCHHGKDSIAVFPSCQDPFFLKWTYFLLCAYAGDTVPNPSAGTARNFGRWLQLQRGERSLEQIAIKVRPLVKAAGLKVDQSMLYKIERGRIPSWPMLAALARAYDQDFRATVMRLVDALEFPGVDVLFSDPLRQADEVPSSSHPVSGSASTKGGAYAAVSLRDSSRHFSSDAKLLALVERAERLIELSNELHRLADDLLSGQAADLGDAEAERVSRPRKTRGRAAG